MKASILPLLVFFGCGLSSSRDVDLKFPRKLRDLLTSEIPSSIIIKGKLIIAKSWEDRNGENLLVVSFTGPTQEKSNNEEFSEERHVELHSALYTKQNKKFNPLWTMTDSVSHCPFDIWIGLLPESTTVTDLDRDSIAEITLVTKKTCRSDISPSSLKIQIFEKDSVMELAGRMEMQSGDTLINEDFEYDLTKIQRTGDAHEIFGRYLGEYGFRNKPKVFLEYAKEKWREYVRRDTFLQLESEK